MLLTVTLDSYGPVHTPRRPGRPDCECGTAHHPDDPKVGMPVDPTTYDYRRAALDSIHFAKLLDRLWQNLRRSAGFKLQYGGCVELQRRLAPHGHFAVRGTLPRSLVKAVAAATYHQVWWPRHDQLVYTPDRPPAWDAELEHFVDPVTGEVLLSWDEALDLVDADPDAEPAHVVTCGRIDPRGIKGGTKDAERSIRYITKDITPEHSGADVRSDQDTPVTACAPASGNRGPGARVAADRPGEGTPRGR